MSTAAARGVESPSQSEAQGGTPAPQEPPTRGHRSRPRSSTLPQLLERPGGDVLESQERDEAINRWAQYRLRLICRTELSARCCTGRPVAPGGEPLCALVHSLADFTPSYNRRLSTQADRLSDRVGLRQEPAVLSPCVPDHPAHAWDQTSSTVERSLRSSPRSATLTADRYSGAPLDLAAVWARSEGGGESTPLSAFTCTHLHYVTRGWCPRSCCLPGSVTE